jgi:hypothetical protein
MASSLARPGPGARFHDPQETLARWLTAAGCFWYPVDLDIPGPSMFVDADVKGESVRLSNDPSDDDLHRVRASCRLGELPRGVVVPTLLQLLQTNLVMALRGQGQALSLDVGDGDAVCLSGTLSVAPGGEAGFRLGLFHLASQAAAWREGRIFPHRPA